MPATFGPSSHLVSPPPPRLRLEEDTERKLRKDEVGCRYVPLGVVWAHPPDPRAPFVSSCSDDGGLPARAQTIVRSEEHGIVPADDAVTEDSLKTRRRVISEPARVRTLRQAFKVFGAVLPIASGRSSYLVLPAAKEVIRRFDDFAAVHV